MTNTASTGPDGAPDRFDLFQCWNPGTEVSAAVASAPRPGYADHKRAVGVAVALLGRAAKDADFDAIGATIGWQRPGHAVGEVSIDFRDGGWTAGEPGQDAAGFDYAGVRRT